MGMIISVYLQTGNPFKPLFERRRRYKLSKNSELVAQRIIFVVVRAKHVPLSVLEPYKSYKPRATGT